MSPRTAPLSRWPFVVLALIAIVDGLYSYAGIAMAASFTVSNPEHAAHGRHVAEAYTLSLGIAGLLLITAGVALWRRHARGYGGHGVSPSNE